MIWSLGADSCATSSAPPDPASATHTFSWSLRADSRTTLWTCLDVAGNPLRVLEKGRLQHSRNLSSPVRLAHCEQQESILAWACPSCRHAEEPFRPLAVQGITPINVGIRNSLPSRTHRDVQQILPSRVLLALEHLQADRALSSLCSFVEDPRAVPFAEEARHAASLMDHARPKHRSLSDLCFAGAGICNHCPALWQGLIANMTLFLRCTGQPARSLLCMGVKRDTSADDIFRERFAVRRNRSQPPCSTLLHRWQHSIHKRN